MGPSELHFVGGLQGKKTPNFGDLNAIDTKVMDACQSWVIAPCAFAASRGGAASWALSPFEFTPTVVFPVVIFLR